MGTKSKFWKTMAGKQLSSLRHFFCLLNSVLCLFLFSGCSYHLGNSSNICAYETINVSYVAGDRDGLFCSLLIEEISRSGCLQYNPCSPRLLLQVKIVDFRDENIGFRYDRNKRGKIIKSVIPTETRLYAEIELSVIDLATGSVLLGPSRLIGTTDFDHAYYSSRDAINVFSLGQVSDEDEALDAARLPLFRNLARKIVNFITTSW